MTWNLPLFKKFWNEISHDPNDFRSTEVSREEAAFFRAMKNFVRSVWDVMSLISPSSSSMNEYFLGLIGVHEFFFHLIFPCANIFFCASSPLPT